MQLDHTNANPIHDRLRERRQHLGLTLKDVALASGLSVGFISQVERGITVPSLSSLVSISKTLHADVAEFLSQPRADAVYSRHDGRRPFKIDTEGVGYERISSSFPNQKLHSVIIHMPPGYQSELISHDGEEMEFVLEGSVTSDLNGNRTILKPGDAVHHMSSKPHSIWNHTEETATTLWVGTLDVFGEHA